MKRAVFILILVLWICNLATAKQVKCTVKVVDWQGRPLEGAEVAVYEEDYNYSTSEKKPKLLAEIGRTDKSGIFVLNAEITSQYYPFAVARKEGLAIGWDVLDTMYSKKDKVVVSIVLERPCSLAGKVVDKQGNAVAGAKVTAIPKTSYLDRLEQTPIIAPEKWFTTRTDSKGNFAFSDFAADVSSDFQIEAPNSKSIYKYTTYYLSGCGFEVGRDDIKLVLPTEVTVRGRVTDKTGKGIAGVNLVIRSDSKKHRERISDYIAKQVISGKNGEFCFEGIPADTHMIRVLSLEDKFSKWVVKSITVDTQPNRDINDVIVKVEKGTMLEVVVRDEQTRQPLEDVHVSAYNTDYCFDTVRRTKNSGKVQFHMPPGQCSIYVTDKSFNQTNEVTIVTKNKTSEVETWLKLKDRIRGVIVDESGRAVEGAEVKINPFGSEVFTDSKGKFDIRCERIEYVFARDTGRNLAAAVKITDYTKPVQITIKPALSIKGQVTDTNGKEIAAARISLSVNLPGTLSRFADEVLTDPDGYYQIAAVPSPNGFNYRLSVNAAGYGRWDYEPVSISGEPGSLVEMQRVELPPADQSISGVVVDADGKPASHVPIFLHGDGQPDRTTATNANGRFVINRICKGPLRLQASISSDPGGAGFMHAEGGDKDVKIILGQEGKHIRQISLIDKALPELKDLGFESSEDESKGKRLLVCFFDYQQRPSRHCVSQLAKKAEQLKEKAVSVVIVQTSKIDTAELNKWVEKYNIPFTIGMIAGDEDKTRFSWGVKALPWLILTDKEHIVKAEGFEISDLEQMIKEVSAK